jgi:hypothetical protein
VQGRISRPDLIVIADTGREVASTWETLAKMRERGFDIHVAPHTLSRVDLYALNGDLLIPAYTRPAGRLGGFCSNEWKQRVVRRWLRAQGVKACDLYMGISMDEAHRMKPSGLQWMRHVYPLLDLGVTRAQCIEAIRAVGWGVPPKSRCFMCPHQSPSEWAELPASEKARAVELEAAIQRKDSNVYLNNSRLPLPEALTNLSGQELPVDGCDSGGYCWT